MTSPAGFLFDFNKCTGCQACELACMIENGLEDASWRQVLTFNPERRPGAPVVHLSMACNHCADAPCAKACPALAYSRDARGFVQLDAEKCIGCRYCSWACPYDAPKFDAGAGVMSKCTFCADRQSAGLLPACVEQCPTGALGCGELDALRGVPEGLGLPTLEPRPSIRFVPWKGDPAPSPESTTARRERKITLRGEWPLLVFTLLAPILVAVVSAAALGHPALAHPAHNAGAFAVLASLSLAASSLHLGRKDRAWRAVLNFRRSWLSREIVLYSAFVGLGGLALVVPAPLLGTAATAMGFAALFAVDRVYDLVRTPEMRPLHSADVLLTGALLTTILLGLLPAALALMAVKVALYARRRHKKPALALRLGLGMALPLLGLVLDPARWTLWAFAGTWLGEMVDRAELYSELEAPVPGPTDRLPSS